MVPSRLPVPPPITSLNPSRKNILFDITPPTMLNKPLSSPNITPTKKTQRQTASNSKSPVQQQLTTGLAAKGEQMKTANENICRLSYSPPKTAEMVY
ncbi:unnamed protein product [Didymodactylos carnosus]|uniref:Uncharacterized protein n=1 Tax=Didymodactylos carnosus TaxID=1234261 RepID=A0A813WF51_9BILA|nr:unnamed protein product [Didymodactylos carnosus]CAF1020637.1 unnamed protein product [Didymodactylos carnosus]CAF3642816.1 unnamed protein product [Didymodactylos carnosus]CAF3789355.1 unnamed protein product [Didymodactylos carnosus]